MKIRFFLPFIFMLVQTVGFSQNDSYQLVENGVKFKKPLFFLHEDQFEYVKIINNKKIFIAKKNRFIYDPKKHTCQKITRSDLRRFNITSIDKLYRLEEAEFEEKADKIEKKTGWRPVPPAQHNILKIYILVEKQRYYYLYEVDWLQG